MRLRSWSLESALIGALLAAGAAAGQGVDVPLTPSSPQARSSVELHYGHLFKADMDNGGDVVRDGASFALTHRIVLTERVGLTLQAGYQLSMYDFSGSSASPGSGSFQWDDVHEARLVGLVDWQIDERWSLLAAVAVLGHGEGGSRFSRGLTEGGALGFDFRASPTLRIGALFGAATAIEESATLFVLPRVDWRFAERGRWRIDVLSTFGGRGVGTELLLEPSDGLEIALGVTRQRRRFWLADHDGLDGGVGEESQVPLFLRLGFKPGPNARLDLLAGVAFAGDLRVEDRYGRRIESDHADPAGLLGFGGRFVF